MRILDLLQECGLFVPPAFDPPVNVDAARFGEIEIKALLPIVFRRTMVRL